MILAAPTQRPISSIVNRIAAWLPRGWGDLGRQLAIFALFDLFYEITRTLAVGDRSVALRHARDIVSAERSLGIFHELDVQHFAATSPHFAASASARSPRPRRYPWTNCAQQTIPRRLPRTCCFRSRPRWPTSRRWP
jgi:hypothetical protein